MSTAVQVREIGVPVKSVSHVQLFAGEHADGSPALYATMAQVGAPFFVIDIDLRTGHCTKFLADLPYAREAVSAHWSERLKVLYGGSCYTGHLHRFDPRVGRVEDLGAINPEKHELACFPCGMDEHPDGTLYISSYNGCDLTRFDPATGEFTRFGRMDETDMYLYVQCGADGTVAALVKMMHPHVVAFDPATGEHRTVGPVADKQAGTGSVELIKGIDGLLYIKSHDGDFRVQGMEAIPVAAAPAPMPAKALPDGTTFRWLDADVFEHRQLELTAPDGTTRVLHLDWEGDGTDIMFCHTGPDGLVYGSSMLPEHLFRYNPGTGEMADLGACSTSGGEAYTMGNLDGKLYIASYPKAMLSIYDPAKPYRFGTGEEANPREVGRPDSVAYRPRGLAAGPAGKVWIASQPDYGTWGGTLAWYDPKTNRFGSHRNIIPECSCQSMTYLAEEDLLLVGFAIEGGTGTQPKAEKAGLALWNPNMDAEVWQGDFGLSINSVEDVCAVGNGLAYAVIILNGEGERPGFYLLDLRKKEIIGTHSLTDPPHGWTVWGTQTMFVHRGWLYGTTLRTVYRAPVGTVEVEVYWNPGEGESSFGGGALIGDTWYFPTAHRLRALELPGK
jgi:streptogramin lyase